MDIQDFGAIGEFVSSLVITVTLVFLVLETRSAKNTMFQSNRQFRQQIQSAIYMANAHDRELATVLIKADSNISPEFAEMYAGSAQEWGLDPGEYWRIINHWRAEFSFIEDQFFTALPITDRATIDFEFIRIMRSPSADRFWNQQRHFFHHEFVSYGNDLITKSGVAVGKVPRDFSERMGDS